LNNPATVFKMQTHMQSSKALRAAFIVLAGIIIGIGFIKGHYSSSGPGFSSSTKHAVAHMPKLKTDDIIYHHMHNTVPIVSEEYKIVFFQVAKAASSEWVRFFMRLGCNPDWCSANTQMHDPEQNGLTYLSDFSLEEANHMMTSDEWTRAIFVRNPKPRILSAFLDKSVEHAKHWKNQTCPVYAYALGENDGTHMQHTEDEAYCKHHHNSFEFFLYNITTIIKDNVHWRSIYSRIDEKWWPKINFIGHMNNISDDAESLLRSINSTKDGVSAWERMGKTGWGENELNCSAIGTHSFLGKRENHHETDARDKMAQYYTPELERFVESHYADDFNNRFYHFDGVTLFEEEGEDKTIEDLF